MCVIFHGEREYRYFIRDVFVGGMVGGEGGSRYGRIRLMYFQWSRKIFRFFRLSIEKNIPLRCGIENGAIIEREESFFLHRVISHEHHCVFLIPRCGIFDVADVVWPVFVSWELGKKKGNSMPAKGFPRRGRTIKGIVINSYTFETVYGQPASNSN